MIGLSVALGLVASLLSWHTGSMTLYNDAKSHLDIARRVTDALTPGYAQLGTVWLPLQQLLLVPLVAIEPAWHSGVAGALVSGVAFAYAAIRIYSLANAWFGNRLVAWTAFIVFALNVNLLYLQSTALQEPLLLAFLVGAIYHLSRWTRTLDARELVAAAAMTFCATLTRYDGWAVLGAAVVLVFIWSRTHDRRSQATEANVLIFVLIGGYGIGLWVLYNLIIFHNPWAFFSGPYSAQSQQTISLYLGRLPTARNLALSALTYGWDIMDVCGLGVVAVAVAGAMTLLAQRLNRGRNLFLLGLLASPVLFNMASLYLGETTLQVPQLSPYQMFNDRYGIMALPLVALSAAALVSWRRWIAPGVMAVALASAVLMAWQTPITVADGRGGISAASAKASSVVAAYLGSHYQGGRVLADDSRVSPLEFSSGMDLKNFVVVGFRPYFERALHNPARHVEWVVVAQGDVVSRDMSAHPGRFVDFKMVFDRGPLKLLKRIASS